MSKDECERGARIFLQRSGVAEKVFGRPTDIRT
jgi:hypothetical protein